MLEIIMEILKNTPNGLAPKSLIHKENKLIFGKTESSEIIEIIVEVVTIPTPKKAK